MRTFYNYLTGNYNDAIIKAVTTQDYETLQLYINDKRSLDFKVGGETPLTIAIKANDIKMVEFLLKHGADADMENSLQRTPLKMAIISDNIELVKLIIKYGADTNLYNHNDDNNPLFEAIYCRNEKIIKFLLENNAGTNGAKEIIESVLEHMKLVIEYNEIHLANKSTLDKSALDSINNSVECYKLLSAYNIEDSSEPQSDGIAEQDDQTELYAADDINGDSIELPLGGDVIH